jgi:hypothetical protein
MASLQLVLLCHLVSAIETTRPWRFLDAIVPCWGSLLSDFSLISLTNDLQHSNHPFPFIPTTIALTDLASNSQKISPASDSYVSTATAAIGLGYICMTS